MIISTTGPVVDHTLSNIKCATLGAIVGFMELMIGERKKNIARNER